MAKLLKLLGGIIVLLLIAIIALPMFIDPNDYREEIITAVEENTGRTLTIEGDIGLSVFPWIGIDIGKLNLGNAKGFGNQPFAAIDNASVKIKLIPLLSKKIEADTITLEGLILNLAKNKQGQTNWSDLAGNSTEPSTSSTQAETTSTSSAGLGGLAIGGININNATIHWQDDQLGQSYDIKNFHLNSGSIAPGQPVDLALGLNLTSTQPEVTAKLSLNGTVSVDDNIEKLTITPLNIQINAQGEPFAKGELQASLSSDIAVNLKALSVSLTNLLIQSGDLDLKGNLTLNNLDKQPAIDGQMKLAKFNLKQWLNDQGMALPEMKNPQALSSFNADIALKSHGNTTEINQLRIELDQTKITGQAQLIGEHIGFNLNIDQMNVDDYTPKSSETQIQKTESSTASSSASTGDEPLFPIELLRSLDIDGKLAIDKLIVSKLVSEQLKVDLVAKKGKITINKSIGKLYNGSFNGKTILNVTGKTPKLSVMNHLSKLQISPLLIDLTGQDKLSGTARFNSNIKTSGNSINAIKRSLNGKLDFRFENGAVKGVNLAKLIRETKAKFDGTTIPPSTEPEQTDFSEMSATAKITQGVVNNQDFLAKSPYLRVKGAGKVNLVKETLNYTVETSIVNSSAGQGGKSLQDLQGLNIPITLSGSYLAPDYQIDWGKVLLSSQKAKVDAKIDAKKQELKTKVQDKVGGMLKGLF